MKVGDYVRIKKYGIRKIEMVIDEPEKKGIRFDDIDGWNKGVPEEEIIKSSPNIIDLIEVGDYVNGYEVTSKDQFLGFGNHDWYMTNDEIKSIVTKEQFSCMEYKIGE